LQAIAIELAQDEAKHVAWLQAQLGIAAIPMPQVWTLALQRAVTMRFFMRSTGTIVPADLSDATTCRYVTI
jgi:hypothetical protein